MAFAAREAPGSRAGGFRRYRDDLALPAFLAQHQRPPIEAGHVHGERLRNGEVVNHGTHVDPCRARDHLLHRLPRPPIVAGKAHHADPTFKRLRAVVVPQAYANPEHRCPTCGRTLAEVRAVTPTAQWDCDHVIPGSLAAGVRARCSPCNRADGARMVNARRSSGYDW